jgi:hypothetical protein
MRGLISILTLVGLLAGCAGKLEYQQPITQQTVSNVKIVNKSKDEVWKTAIANLSKNFFVINNIDKSSGFINVSYSGDPEKFINCGTINSYVSNTRGERNYTFPASSAFQRYEAMENGVLVFLERKMNLEGRINIIVEEMTKDQTRITVNIKYVVDRHLVVKLAGNNMTNRLDNSITFNTNSSSSFQSSGKSQPVLCFPTGTLEASVLEAFD